MLDRVGEYRVFPTVGDGVEDYLERHPAARHASVAPGFPSASEQDEPSQAY